MNFVFTHVGEPPRSEEAVRSAGAGVTGGCLSPDVGAEDKLRDSEGQPMPSPAGPPLLPQHLHFLFYVYECLAAGCVYT